MRGSYQIPSRKQRKNTSNPGDIRYLERRGAGGLSDAAGRLLATLFADPVDLEGMAARSRNGACSPLSFVPAFSTSRREELHRTPTVGAHHVVVAAAVVLVLVASDAVMKSDLAGKSTFREQLERAVDRRESDLRVFLFHQAVKLICRHVVPGLEERLQDSVALFGMLQADPLQVTMQDLLRFAHRLA